MRDEEKNAMNVFNIKGLRKSNDTLCIVAGALAGLLLNVGLLCLVQTYPAMLPEDSFPRDYNT